MVLPPELPKVEESLKVDPNWSWRIDGWIGVRDCAPTQDVVPQVRTLLECDDCKVVTPKMAARMRAAAPTDLMRSLIIDFVSLGPIEPEAWPKSWIV